MYYVTFGFKSYFCVLCYRHFTRIRRTSVPTKHKLQLSTVEPKSKWFLMLLTSNLGKPTNLRLFSKSSPSERWESRFIFENWQTVFIQLFFSQTWMSKQLSLHAILFSFFTNIKSNWKTNTNRLLRTQIGPHYRDNNSNQLISE